ncbi:MAG TPA: hypothetical protein PLZ53_02805 [Candidatus Hydrogenedentes bacterium]|jgi:4-hydroxy-3-methylbut-2-en-1-yl diphosphate synthase IspG/GcpE|nr:MAG: hypothetical protein BWY07_01598 [Candidatus Hydrogenedentes bacterium ADurb.Bin170]HNZ49165.1 hypothetical protein [Candidatus Hydrogenedentota bacterium]HOD96278.1 hypothetical protein [Candidatus Hydrogenedentota bacterium]HOH42018.1 hypothetical protein [Candidatus Hydrogenedentota bacterium]HOM49603.1 hypothetical protein [Candidatus Hydrogenedentota bacterium]
MNLFWGARLAQDLRDVQNQIEKDAQVARQQRMITTETNDLRNEVERLCLLNQAMWELICSKLGLTDADLEKKAQEVDLRDGKLDGKMTTHPVRCPQCGRVSNSRLKKCMYCNMEFEGSAFG